MRTSGRICNTPPNAQNHIILKQKQKQSTKYHKTTKRKKSAVYVYDREDHDRTGKTEKRNQQTRLYNLHKSSALELCKTEKRRLTDKKW